MDSAFDPRNQTFFIASANGSGTADIPISMAAIDAQRVRLANVSVNYGVQLGLCLLTLVVVLMLLPTRRLRRGIHLVQVAALAIAVLRLVLLVLYFPGPLSQYYVAWTRDASILQRTDYYATTTSEALSVLQWAAIEAALILQSRAMIATWPERWHLPTQGLSVILAVATVVVKAIWTVRRTRLLVGHALPIPLDPVGKAAVVLGAASIFFFCGLFFGHLSLHLVVTRGVLQRPERGLSSLEILAIGNGVLMLIPSLFAGLDIAAGPGNTRVLPFDAGSWVQTLVVSGMPLIGLVALYRGFDSQSGSRRGQVSLFAAGAPFRYGSRAEGEEDITTLRNSINPDPSFVVRGGAVKPPRPSLALRSNGGIEMGTMGKGGAGGMGGDQDSNRGFRARRDDSFTVEADRAPTIQVVAGISNAA